MPGLRFETAGAAPGTAPERADIACFAGFVARRPTPRPSAGGGPYTPVPEGIRRWLHQAGWATRHPGGTPRRYERDEAAVHSLLHLPVPIDAWDVFDRLFAWDRRPYPGGARGGTALGAAVRSFFAAGGRRCYVIRAGDPWDYGVPRAARLAALAELIPGWPGGFESSPVDRTTWKGIAHLYGLPDVSFLSLPDLADAAAAEPVALRPIRPPTLAPEVFRECAADETVAEKDLRLSPIRAPRADETGYARWADAVRLAGMMLRGRLREVQLVASLPIPIDQLHVPGTAETEYLRRPLDVEAYADEVARRDASQERYLAGDSLLRFLTEGGWLRGTMGTDPGSIASAFVQLAYPWVRTPGSEMLPEGIEGPEGTLVGMLARNALLRGTFRSAGSLDAGDAWEVFPAVTRDQLERALRETSGKSGPERTLAQRVSLFGPTPAGVRLLSDVTTSRDESYRPAGINRLIAAVVRAARRVGEEVTFEPSGERLWRQVRDALDDLLTGLLREGALRGSEPGEAFTVRCDRSTMTQADLDAGRVIAVVTLQPAAPVEEIVVVLGMEEGGVMQLVEAPALEAAA